MRSHMVLHRILGLAMAVAMFAMTLGAQAPAPAPAPPSTGGAGAPTAPTPSPLPTPTPTRPTQPPTIGEQPQRTPFPDMQRPLFLSGKVNMDDGTPPPDSVVIEMVCNGMPRPQAYTDSKGRFSFQVGQNTHVMADASVSSAADPVMGTPGFGTMGGQRQNTGFGGSRGITERDLMSCELRAALPGFRSEVVSLAGRRIMDNPDVGTIILHRLGSVEGFTFSATTGLAPKDARKAYDKAKELAKKNKLPEAQKEFEKAVQIYPKYAVAWYELGLVHEEQKNKDAAFKAYGESLAADSKFTKPYLQLAKLYAADRKWQEVADTSSRALKLNPFDAQVYFFHAVASLNLQKLDDAEKSAREAVKLDSGHRIPKASHLLGIVLAQKQDYTGAIENIKNYLKFAPNASDAELAKKQLAEIEKFTAAKAGTPPPEQQ